LDIRDLKYKLLELGEKIPGEGADKIKLVAVATLLPVLVIFLIYFAVTSLAPGRVARAQDSPAWRLANEFNEKLIQEAPFRGVGFAVESESPIKFMVNGTVQSENDRAKLMEKLKELRPEGDYELQVEVLGH